MRRGRISVLPTVMSMAMRERRIRRRILQRIANFTTQSPAPCLTSACGG